MGYRISWLAVENVGRRRLLDALELTDTGIPDEANEADFSIAELPTGWTVLWANDEAYADATGRRLSNEMSPVLAVYVNETCMHSTAVLFEAGRERWCIHHEGDERVDFLQFAGVLPVEVREIEAQLRARQAEEDAVSAEVDYLFDMPLEVARTVCGYKHDQSRFDWGEASFYVAQPVSQRA